MPKQRNQVVASAGTAAPTGIATSQSLGAAGPLTLNGTLVSTTVPTKTGGTVTNPGGPYKSGQILVPGAGLTVSNGRGAVLSPAQNVVITSAGNDSTLNWTITGTDASGSPLTEVLAGGNAVAVTSALLYATVTSIVGSQATASTVTAGTGATQFSQWLIIGAQRNEFSYQVRTFLAPGGSATYDIQTTSDINLMNQTGGYADDIDTVLAAQTGNTSSYPVAPWIGIRLRVTAGGTVTLRVLENRTA